MTTTKTPASWYKDAVIYETHVRAFHDSNGDGVGDFPGLTAKLDYLQDLGVTALWLLPFYPSPLKDDGYDIAHYTAVHADYGTLRDFKTLLAEAHNRGLKVITELVLNHTSDQHPWFQRARTAKPGSPWRNFYVWSDTPEKYQDARVIFQDFETSNWSWDPVAQSYFWHRFYSHQPDLNFDSPHVRKAILKVVDFWLDLGVDGLRLDAVPYLFEREGTTGENLPQTHVALRRLRRHIDERYTGRMLLAEANQWPEDAVAYFGNDDECHMAFHFPLMPRLFMAVRMEDRFPIIDIMDQTPDIPENSQWALFLRNHDELTLEMVTEEERFYMYRSYAQNAEARINLGIRRRLAPLLGNDRRRIELLNGLLCSLPGTPVLYYGDEIGMGDNVYLGDRNSVRTPMQWSADRNGGFSKANPQQLFLPLISDHEYHHETINVEAQRPNSHSLLNWMRRLLKLRKRYHAFGRGSLRFLHPENHKVLAFVREHENERILVAANMSRFLQHVELDLADFKGCVPTELFGRTAFPPVGELPYLLTLAPHSFYWFALEPTGAGQAAATDTPTIELAGPWTKPFRGEDRVTLEAALPHYLQSAIWFGGKSRPILDTTIVECIGVPYGDEQFWLTLVRVSYADGEPRMYAVPLALAEGAKAKQVQKQAPEAVIAQVELGDDRAPSLLYDGLWAPEMARALFDSIARHQRFKGERGLITARGAAAYRQIRGRSAAAIPAATIQAEHNNTSVVFDNSWILKLFRCVDEGINPEVEIGDFLTARGFAHTPPVLASLEYQPERGEPISLATLQGFVPNQGEAWDWAQQALRRFFKQAIERKPPRSVDASTAALLRLAGEEPSKLAQELMGDSLPMLRQLGQRTAELHRALATDDTDPNFAPQPFTNLYQRSLYQSMRGLLGNVMHLLRRNTPTLEEWVHDDANAILQREAAILKRFRRVADERIEAVRTRIHGDYHLEQVLVQGDDVVIFDFEGESQRPTIERRLKSSPLRDVATMLRSLQYATYAARMGNTSVSKEGWDEVMEAEPWARFWYQSAAAAFLSGYLGAAADSGLLPANPDATLLLLDTFTLEKAVYELRYELDNRPDWVCVALLGVQHLLG